MNTIWKYELDANSPQTIQLPKGAEVLSVQVQNGIPCMWCLVDTSGMGVKNSIFHILATGQEIPSATQDECTLKYIGTYQIGTHLVFHVFEERQ